MNDTNKAAADHAPGERAPIQDQRSALVRAYQQQALGRTDPLAANLGMIAADLMGFAHGLASLVQTQLGPGSVSEQARERLVADAELYLRFVRQFDRLVQLERQLGDSSKGRTEGT